MRQGVGELMFETLMRLEGAVLNSKGEQLKTVKLASLINYTFPCANVKVTYSQVRLLKANEN